MSPNVREVLRDTRDGAGCLLGAIGFLFALAAFWVGISYALMVGAWLLGTGDLHPFPPYLWIPDGCSSSDPSC